MSMPVITSTSPKGSALGDVPLCQPLSPTSVSDFELQQQTKATANPNLAQDTPVATSDYALALCSVSAVSILAVIYNTPSLNSVLENFHWTPSEARANVWLPIAIVCTWAVSLWSLKAGPLRNWPAMRSKTFELFHNAALTCFSIMTVLGIVIAANQRATEDGGSISGLFCTARNDDTMWDGAIGFWTYLYYLSKFWELADTMVLTFRKKTVIPLQLWHHGVMPFVTLSWFASPWLEGAWWCVMVNSVIHSFMYFYYLQSCRGVKVWWKRHLTTLQIVQFCTGMGCCLWYGMLKSQIVQIGQPVGCGGNVWGALFSIGVNGSFLVMFALFFVKTYLTKKNKKA